MSDTGSHHQQRLEIGRTSGSRGSGNPERLQRFRNDDARWTEAARIAREGEAARIANIREATAQNVRSEGGFVPRIASDDLAVAMMQRDRRDRRIDRSEAQPPRDRRDRRIDRSEAQPPRDRRDRRIDRSEAQPPQQSRPQETGPRLGEASGSRRRLDAPHVPDRNVPSGHETVSAIDGKIDNVDVEDAMLLMYDTLSKARRVNPHTQKFAERLYDGFSSIHTHASYKKESDNRYNPTEAADAYNRLKDEYYHGGLNSTAKRWYKRAGFDYAQDD